ncbi:MAG: 16S rRNA (uracil(1498)-N(3))-methyltransferase [bacterium]
MRYFFITPDRVFQDTLMLDRETGRHIRNVLRMRVGDALKVSDGSGLVYRVKISGFPEGEVLCAILGKSSIPDPHSLRVTLLQSVPKGKRMEWLVQKAAEVGVHEIVPIYMERSVRVLGPERTGHWIQRWQRIAKEASQQCGRPDFPRIKAPVLLNEALKQVETVSVRIYFNENEKRRILRDIRDASPEPESIALLVGPEGGISPEEAKLIEEHGFVSVSLGDMILRSETAGILSVALVRYEWGAAEPGGIPGLKEN